MADIREYLNKAEEVEPIAEIGGRKIMSFEDQRNIATAQNINGEDLGGLKFNPDGTLARTKGDTAAVNLDSFYSNRYRKVKNKYYIVTDLMAIDGAQRGQMPYTSVTAYVIAQVDGKIVCEKRVPVSDKDFIADYTHTLDHASMKLVLNAIAEAGVEREADKLEF